MYISGSDRKTPIFFFLDDTQLRSFCCIFRQVCKICFDKGPQEVGQTRSLSSLYVQWREAVHHPDNDLTGDAVDGRVVFTE